MKRAVLVLSDVHLAPTFDSDRLPFRSACFSPAVYLSQTIDHAVEHAQRLAPHSPLRGARTRDVRCCLEIVLAGDVFDFDVPQSAQEAALGLRSADTTTPEAAAEVLHRTLLDHLPFTLALQRAARAGARVVVLPGNHDAQLGFTRVQNVLARTISSDVTSASLAASPTGETRASLAAPPRPYTGRSLRYTGRSLLFAPWYYAAAGGAVHVEHGHLYDPLCVVSRLCLDNMTNTERTIGTVSSFYAPLLLPDMDPFVTDPFAERRSFRTMIAQALPDTRSLLACMRELFVVTAKSGCASDEATVLALELGIEPAEVDYRRAFFAPKATASEVLDICRGSVDYGGSVEERTRRAMEAATTLRGASVAVVGHTHRAGATLLANGRMLLNSGAWTPRRTPAEPVGSYAWITTDEGRIDDASVKHVYRA